jgi:hypothetical protein
MRQREDTCAVLAGPRRRTAPAGRLLVYGSRLPNPSTAAHAPVRRSDLDAAGVRPGSKCPVTLLPVNARRLGRAKLRMYGKLSRVPMLRSHRFIAWTSPG